MAAAGNRIKQVLMAAGRRLAQRAAEKHEETLEKAVDIGTQVYDKAKKPARQQGASSSRSSTVPPRQPPLNVDVGAHPSRRWNAASCFRGGGERSIGGEDAAAQHNPARAPNLCGLEGKIQLNFVELSRLFGYDLHLMVAVDFTESNGDSRLRSSLHFRHPSGILNPYQETIQRVGGPIQMEASDKRFHAWGFGGVVIVNDPDQNHEVSHAFNLNGEDEVVGVDGILSAYSMACTNVAQFRPIQFSGVLNRAVDIVSRPQHNKYSVLLIIATGVPTPADLPATVDALVRGAELPLSVLVVGLGGTDFEELEKEVLARGPRQDFVKFGSLSDVLDGEFLAEIPKQFMSYIRYRHMKPM